MNFLIKKAHDLSYAPKYNFNLNNYAFPNAFNIVSPSKPGDSTT